jgi:folate-dependent phosphoribosylglycinamide formyltransferase PurN
MSFKSIRAAVLTSTAVRHLYFHWVISENFDVRAALVQGKGNYYDSQREESELVRSHFSNLAAAESAEFKARLNPSLPRREVPDINEPELVVETLAAGTEIVFLLGTAILPEAWLNAFPNRILNLHLGLSPFDRGSATLFWPFAQNELECVGANVHLAVADVDAGSILARVKPDLQVGDNYYSITNRLIRQSIDALPCIASRYLTGEVTPLHQVPTGERAWRKADFSEASLCRA